jgi:hypothetical protein
MPTAPDLAETVVAMRPMVPAKDFEISKRFYIELGFQPRILLPDRLVEMSLGPFSFILQAYYVREWADNFVVHMTVADVTKWWNHILALDLTARYRVKITPPQTDGWATIAGVTDPSGVLWRFAQLCDAEPAHQRGLDKH